MNDLSFIDFLAQSYNSSPDGIKLVWTIGVISFIISLIWIPFHYVIRWRELSFQMKEQTILGKAALKDYEMFRRVILQQQELLAVPDVDAELYNLPDCPIPVVKSLHSVNDEWPDWVRDAHQKPAPNQGQQESSLTSAPSSFPSKDDSENGGGKGDKQDGGKAH